jgi:molecular chaperone GrpE
MGQDTPAPPQDSPHDERERAGAPQPGPVDQPAVASGRQPAPAEEEAPAGEDKDKIAALEDRLRRVLADLDNLRKRFAREAERARAAERDRVIAAWLPVLDALDLALRHAAADPSSIIEGVRAVREQALGVLADLGYTRYDEVGVPFDPARHEVVEVVQDTQAEPGTVVQVLRPGYGSRQQQLRPGAVAVAGRRG